jgi:regulator of sirC expression with transglutaminase-like and TPR domain
MLPLTRADAEAALKAMGLAGPHRLDLTAACLACSIHEHPDEPSGEALAVLEELTAAALKYRPASLEALSDLLYARFAFIGDDQDYDSPHNADLRRVLVRRKGLPVALGVVWRHVGRVLDLPLMGTNMPGHFLMRLDSAQDSGEAQLIDVFQGGVALGQAYVERLARQAGAAALEPSMTGPVADLVIALRLQTNLASRARANGEVEAWERACLRRALLAPGDARLHLEHAEAAQACGLLTRARAAAEQARATAHTPEHAAAAQALLDRTARKLQ